MAPVCLHGCVYTRMPVSVRFVSLRMGLGAYNNAHEQICIMCDCETTDVSVCVYQRGCRCDRVGMLACVCVSTQCE